MKVVLDTNILVSGLLSPYGAAADIMRLMTSGVIGLYYDARIILEFHEVLARPKFQFDQKKAEDLLGNIEVSGEAVASKPLPAHLPDIHNEMFLEVALEGQAAFLITGNIKHFPESKRQGIKVVTPREFMEHFRKMKK